MHFSVLAVLELELRTHGCLNEVALALERLSIIKIGVICGWCDMWVVWVGYV